MIRGKESFISNVSRCLGRNTPPAEPSAFTLPGDAHRQYLKDAAQDELKRIFRKNSEANGTTVIECTETGLNNAIAEALDGFEAGSVVVGRHEYFIKHGVIKALKERMADCRIWDRERSGAENMADADTADAGIVIAELGLAESGTALLFCQGSSGRSVSLLPTYSIIVVRAGTLRPRLTQGMDFLEQMKPSLPSAVVFVSGASSTADIELVPVKGVHGPMKLAYVVVDQEQPLK